MTDQEDNINLGKIVIDDQQSRKEILVLFGTNLFQIADCVSVSTFCLFVDQLWLLLENSPFKNF